ncbi:hypothetical protein HDU67_004252 [Dinochytrium kinnereticum]|nr:hypothetical protein HDU67_004252 [Dinochytrium kinnereticum]
MKRRPSNEGPSKKKVRFDGGEGAAGPYDDRDDDDLEDLEMGKKKRNAIKEGYTESDDEELHSDEDAGNAGNGGDDEDMFSTEKKNGPQKKPKKGTVEYISRQKIYEEGAERDEDEDEDEEGGVKMESFNMDQELEEGGFDADFNYIRKKDEHQMHDNWLQGVTKEDMKKARMAHSRLEARAKAKEAMDASNQESETTLWLRLLGFLKQKESVAGAMKRLGANTAKQPAWKKKKAEKAATTFTDDDTAKENAKELEQMISVTDKLIELGHYEVIDQRYESIVRRLRQADILSDDWSPGDPLPTIARSGSKATSEPKSQSLWEYKWGKDSAELFGPYGSDMMEEWRKNGFFDAEKGDLWVREVTGDTPLDSQKGFLHNSEVSFADDPME